jgi:hypothetical protein
VFLPRQQIAFLQPAGEYVVTQAGGDDLRKSWLA